MAALQKRNLEINFANGLETKSDPKQIQADKFLRLTNTVFNKNGLLQKRFGFPNLTTLPVTTATTLTTFKENLTAIGNNLLAYSADNDQWYNQGVLQPVDLSVLSLVRSSNNQTACDVAIAPSGLACTVWYDSDTRSKYQIMDSVTGQVIVGQTNLPATAVMARVFTLRNYFIVTFLATVAATPHLQYIAIPVNNPNNPTAAVDISTTVSSLSAGYDGYVANNNLYLAWDTNAGGGQIKIAYLTSALVLSTAVTVNGHPGDLVSITADISGSTAVIWVTYYENATMLGYTTVYSQALVEITAPFKVLDGQVVVEITSVASDLEGTLYFQNNNTYSFTPNARTDFISSVTYDVDGNVVTALATIARSVGIASKAFLVDGHQYLLATYSGQYQPTYFLIDASGNVIAKLAYTNGGGYNSTQVLSNVIVTGQTAQLAYRFKDLEVPVNKTVNANQVSGIYSQTGVNLVTFDLSNTPLINNEIGQNLQISGGFLWMYDGIKPVEQNFHLYPENITVTTSGAGGLITAQTYFYATTYEWTDAQGNVHRSAPSVPVSIVTTGATSTNTINIPTLRLTYKVAPNKVRLVTYRWSTANPIFYQISSITSPTLNDTTADKVTITDTVADSSIIGNLILYTTGGVVENSGGPPCSIMAIFQGRLFLIDSENDNLGWYSKQVIQNVPVEMSPLFTQYIAPTLSPQGPSGRVKALAAMDDKLVFFRKDALSYMVGRGPDITGAQNDFSDPVYIASTVGSDNPFSIVLIPQGLMFQSDKGIWLLGRNLQTQYIGYPVERYNDLRVVNALAIPGTNEVHLTLEDGTILMYDYFQDQWGTFDKNPGLSATIYQDCHTYLNNVGIVRQQTPGSYLDGSNPVLMGFTTAWFKPSIMQDPKVGMLQGYGRAYFFYFLGQYITPHKLQMGIAYDYDSSITQSTTVTPDNFNPAYGGDPLYGSSSPYGGGTSREQGRIFLTRQRCQAFQITLQEFYDPTLGVAAGAGFTMSGLNLIIGVKKTFPTLRASHDHG